jgi:histidine triad (HIT) family protein
MNTEIAAACTFCAIASGDRHADVVYEDDVVICFLPLTLNAYGHTLIVPRAHYATLWDIDRQVIATLIAVVRELSLTYRSSLGATGFNLLHASGRAAQQSVPHFHLHLLPRFEGDGLDAWPPLPAVQVNRSELLQRLRPSRTPSSSRGEEATGAPPA